MPTVPEKFINKLVLGEEVKFDLTQDDITPDKLRRISELNALAAERGQSLAQMALRWVLRDKRVTSVLVGASSAEQLLDSLGALDSPDFSSDELQRIEQILA